MILACGRGLFVFLVRNNRLRLLLGCAVIRSGCRRIGFWPALFQAEVAVQNTPTHYHHHQTPELFIVEVVGRKYSSPI